MSFIIPGQPKEVTDIIEFPDIAELLAYPIFMVAEAETVRKYGTDFQKKLLDLAPLRNNTKHVTVYSAVHLLNPNIRPITGFASKLYRFPGEEWHVDGLEGGKDNDHAFPKETIHLVISHSSFRTRFNHIDLEFDDKFAEMTITEFSNFISRKNIEHIEKYGNPLFHGPMIDANKIYTFSNNLHTVTPVTRLEFRYTCRIRETDRDDIPSIDKQICSKNYFTELQFDGSTKRQSNIFHNDNITINYPAGLWNYYHKYKGE